ncbi:MAG: hypothetical protein WAW86_10860 [Gammaproteobacteria bacterium]
MIDKLCAWGEKYQLVNIQIENNILEFREKFKKTKPCPADYFPLYSTGVKELAQINELLENGPASLVIKKYALKNLLLNLDKCGPGALNPILNTCLLLRTDLDSQFMIARKELAETIAIDAIRSHQPFILEQMPGSEIHWVNWLLNLYHTDLSLLPIADSHATDAAFGDLSVDIKKTFEEQIAKTLSVSWLAERMIDQSECWQYLAQLDPNTLQPDDTTNFKSWLDSYWPQPNFHLSDLIEETEDGMQCWHPGRTSILKHQIIRRLMLAGYVKNCGKRYSWEEGSETIMLCLPYQNSLDLAYVVQQMQETPLAIFGSALTITARTARMVRLVAPIMPTLNNVVNFLDVNDIETLNILTNRSDYLPGISRLIERFQGLNKHVIWHFLNNIAVGYPWVDILLDDDLHITKNRAHSILNSLEWDQIYLPDFYPLISIIQTLPADQKKGYFDLAYDKISESPNLLGTILIFFNHHSKDNVAHYHLGTELLKHLLDNRLEIRDVRHLLDSKDKLALLFDVLNCQFRMARMGSTISHSTFFTHKSEEELIAEQIRKKLIGNKNEMLNFQIFAQQARNNMQSVIQKYETIFGRTLNAEPSLTSSM